MVQRKDLNLRQQKFIQEYLKDFNATEAAKKAGYSEKTAYSIGPRLLNNVEVWNGIQKEFIKRHEAERKVVNEIYNFMLGLSPIAFLVLTKNLNSKDPKVSHAANKLWFDKVLPDKKLLESWKVEGKRFDINIIGKLLHVKMKEDLKKALPGVRDVEGATDITKAHTTEISKEEE